MAIDDSSEALKVLIRGSCQRLINRHNKRFKAAMSASTKDWRGEGFSA